MANVTDVVMPSRPEKPTPGIPGGEYFYSDWYIKLQWDNAYSDFQQYLIGSKIPYTEDALQEALEDNVFDAQIGTVSKIPDTQFYEYTYELTSSASGSICDTSFYLYEFFWLLYQHILTALTESDYSSSFKSNTYFQFNVADVGKTKTFFVSDIQEHLDACDWDYFKFNVGLPVAENEIQDVGVEISLHEYVPEVPDILSDYKIATKQEMLNIGNVSVQNVSNLEYCPYKSDIGVYNCQLKQSALSYANNQLVRIIDLEKKEIVNPTITEITKPITINTTSVNNESVGRQYVDLINAGSTFTVSIPLSQLGVSSVKGVTVGSLQIIGPENTEWSGIDSAQVYNTGNWKISSTCESFKEIIVSYNSFTVKNSNLIITFNNRVELYPKEGNPICSITGFDIKITY